MKYQQPQVGGYLRQLDEPETSTRRGGTFMVERGQTIPPEGGALSTTGPSGKPPPAPSGSPQDAAALAAKVASDAINAASGFDPRAKTASYDQRGLDGKRDRYKKFRAALEASDDSFDKLILSALDRLAAEMGLAQSRRK